MINVQLPNIDPHMIANNLVASNPMHPGELLRDELEARGITQKHLSEELGIRRSILSEIIHGKRSISTEYALLFEAALGIDADFWLKLQADYNKEIAKADAGFMQRLNRIRQIAAVL